MPSDDWQDLTPEEIELGVWAAQRAAGNASLAEDRLKATADFLEEAERRGLASGPLREQILSHLETSRTLECPAEPPYDPLALLLHRALRRPHGSSKVLLLVPTSAVWDPAHREGHREDFVSEAADEIKNRWTRVTDELSNCFPEVQLVDYSSHTAMEIFGVIQDEDPDALLLTGPNLDYYDPDHDAENDGRVLAQVSEHVAELRVRAAVLPAIASAALKSGSHMVHLALETGNPHRRNQQYLAAVRRAIAEHTTHIDVCNLASIDHPGFYRESNTTLYTCRIGSGDEACMLRFSLARSWLDWVVRLASDGIPGPFPRRETAGSSTLVFPFEEHDAEMPWLIQLMQPALRDWRGQLEAYGTWTTLGQVAWIETVFEPLEEWAVDVEGDSAPWSKTVSVADVAALKLMKAGFPWARAAKRIAVLDEDQIDRARTEDPENGRWDDLDGRSLHVAKPGDLIFTLCQESYQNTWSQIPFDGGETVLFWDEFQSIVQFRDGISESLKRWIAAWVTSPACEAIVHSMGIDNLGADWSGELGLLPVPIPNDRFGRSFQLSLEAESTLIQMAESLAKTRKAIFEANHTPDSKNALHSITYLADSLHELVGQDDLTSVTIRSLFPFPIAWKYRDLLERDDPWLRFEGAVRLAENVAAIVWAFERLQRPPDRAAIQRFESNIERGISFSFLIKALRDSERAVSELALYDAALLTSRHLLIEQLEAAREYRIGWAHQRITRSNLDASTAENAVETLKRVLHHCLFLASRRIVVAERVVRDADSGLGSSFRGRAIVGAHPRGWIVTESCQGAIVVEEHPYLVTPDRAPRRVKDFLSIKMVNGECVDWGVVDKRTPQGMMFRSLLGNEPWLEPASSASFPLHDSTS